MVFNRGPQLQKILNLVLHSRRMSTTSSDILFEIKNKCGLITFNKPKALNSVNHEMAQALNAHLKKWEDQVSMVVIKGVGKAFCAGGDLKESISGGPEDNEAVKAFFKMDYTNDYIVANYKKPYIAIMDGITMGSGAGLSVNGRYRVATEKTLFAMPETSIGLFPDVGASYFLSRLPGRIGMFLGLTGHRLRGADCNKVGLATHYCDSEDVPQLVEGLVGGDGSLEAIESTLKQICKDTSTFPFSLADKQEVLDRIFGLTTVEEIFRALEKEGSDWSKEVLKTLKKMSPLSLKVTHKEINLGKTMSLKECIQMEHRLCFNALDAKVSKDFYEGVRALLIDKDKNPRWNPARLEDISSSMVDQYFESLPAGKELIF